ncbi:alpha-galactosidase [Horticoccus luteus]|uniref:Alpha-galactosidase n=1 Tax=Horticoccus luteus TaxID=2862869 RepID=A0A8F9TT33_9BACT|nr:alpha-galactosidase [Horticoccus luteus]QYM78555.1 alpha-galactosidase [Horticoccus luteus]
MSSSTAWRAMLPAVLALAFALVKAAAAPELVTLNFAGGTRVTFETPSPVLGGGEILPDVVFDAQGRGEVAGLQLQRTLEAEPGGYRLKVAVTNRRATAIELGRVTLLRAVGADSVNVAGTTVKAWTVYRLARQKNDVPGPFRPSVWDDASRDAATDSAKAVVGGKPTDDPVEASPMAGPLFHSDPALVIMPDGKAQADLFIGFDGQTRHLNDIELALTSAADALAHLTATAEFDNVRVAPGETRETHWLHLQSGKSCAELLAEHVARIRQAYGGRSSPLRNVFCTWYFYGPEIVADDLRTDLRAMRARPLSFDTFLIDYNWDDNFGDWNADPARFPDGMKAMADEITAAGLAPGIWTCPFIIESNAEVLKKYPDLPLLDRAGQPIEFKTDMGHCYILDPTAPSAETFLTELCHKLTGWGYRYLKFDFLRAVVINENAVFHDRSKNRAQAYRHGLEVLRKAAGEKTVIGVWGGLFEANAGLVDINRSGSDVRGHWDPRAGDAYATRYPVRMRQTFARAIYDEALWTSDQDALQLRRRTTPWRKTKLHLSMGNFTDEEAFSTVVYRFLGGGVVQVSDKLDEVPPDRYALYHAALPTYAPVAQRFYPWAEYLPEYFSSAFQHDGVLPPWVMVSLCNWNGAGEKTLAFKIGDVPHLPPGEVFAAFEYKTQRYLGTFSREDRLSLLLPAHAARVVRLTPLTAEGRYLVGGDLNLSCGMELASADAAHVRLREEVKAPTAHYTFLNWHRGQGEIERVEAQPATGRKL